MITWLIVCVFSIAVIEGIYQGMGLPENKWKKTRYTIEMIAALYWFKAAILEECTIQDDYDVLYGFWIFLWVIVLGIIAVFLISAYNEHRRKNEINRRKNEITRREEKRKAEANRQVKNWKEKEGANYRYLKKKNAGKYTELDSPEIRYAGTESYRDYTEIIDRETVTKAIEKLYDFLETVDMGRESKALDYIGSMVDENPFDERIEVELERFAGRIYEFSTKAYSYATDLKFAMLRWMGSLAVQDMGGWQDERETIHDMKLISGGIKNLVGSLYEILENMTNAADAMEKRYPGYKSPWIQAIQMLETAVDYLERTVACFMDVEREFEAFKRDMNEPKRQEENRSSASAVKWKYCANCGKN